MKTQLIKWKRNCPSCDNEIIHKNNRCCKDAIKRKSVCHLCANILRSKTLKGHLVSITTRKKIGEHFKGKTYEEISGKDGAQKRKNHLKEITTGENNGFYGKQHSKENKWKQGIRTRDKKYNDIYGKRTAEIKEKMSKSMKGKTKGLSYEERYGVNRVEDICKKIRLGNIKWIEDTKNNGLQITPRYNKNSISILEQKAKELGITDLQHAENGGEFYIKELGYWVDGYSKEKNIVIEYYEKYHKSRIEKDKQRKKEIKKYLKCKFIIIKEWENLNE